MNNEYRTQEIKRHTFIYDVVETIVDDKVYAELVWDIQNAKNITINKEPAAESGFKKMLIDKTICTTFRYSDVAGNHTKRIRIAEEKKSIWIIWEFLKYLLRPFTFVGYVGRREMKITNICFSIAVLLLIGVFCICNLNNLSNLTNQIIFANVFKNSNNTFGILIGIMYLWFMQMGRRFKELGHSPYISLIFFPLLLIPLSLFYQNVLIEYFPNDTLEVFFAAYGVFFFIFWITSLVLASKEDKRKKRYKKIIVW